MTNTESDALIAQLRQHDAGISRGGVSVTIFSEAADRIAALEAEVAELKRALREAEEAARAWKNAYAIGGVRRGSEK